MSQDSPLTDLAIALILGEPPPFAWVVEYGTQATFCAAWKAENKPETIVELYSYVDPRRAVLALCRVAQSLFPKLETARDEDTAIALVRIAEAWSNGNVSEDVAFALANGVKHSFGSGPGYWALRTAVLVARVPHLLRMINTGQLDSHAGIGYAATTAARAVTGNDNAEYSVDVARLIRTMLPCPSVTTLIARCTQHRA